MLARTSASPSPPPDAPQTSSNEPGPRALALKKIYASALQSTLKSNSYLNFASCFPTPATYCPSALEGVWRQLNTRLEEECQKDFEKILEERKVIEGLNGLDLLMIQARERRDRGIEGDEPVALHTLSAQELGEARLHRFLVKSKQELDGKLNETQQDNLRIMDSVKSQREEIEKMLVGLESLVEDLEGAVKVLESNNGDEMKREVVDIDEELRAAT